MASRTHERVCSRNDPVKRQQLRLDTSLWINDISLGILQFRFKTKLASIQGLSLVEFKETLHMEMIGAARSHESYNSALSDKG